MAKLSINEDLSDGWRDGLSVVKAWLADNEEAGITHTSSLEDVFCICATVGIGAVYELMRAGEWERYAEEVRLGNEIDDILRGS